jgi:hypothetical protein
MDEPTASQRDVDTDLQGRHPERYPDLTVTQQYSIPYETVMDIQLAVLRMRFDTLVHKVPVLAKLAESQGIGTIQDICDAAPLLFPHSIYKSYPLSLLEKGRFDLLTKWLGTAAVHAPQQGVATGVLITCQQIGLALGVSLALTVFTASSADGGPAITAFRHAFLAPAAMAAAGLICMLVFTRRLAVQPELASGRTELAKPV